MHKKILLEQNRTKKSVNTSEGMVVSLAGKQKLFRQDDLYEKVNAYDQYVQERLASTKIRLTMQVETVCSNVLYNQITEVVKDEGSSDVSIINYGLGGDIDGVIVKDNTMDKWSGSTEAVRDTQLSRPEVGYVYHCGKNIFNNHILRNNVFRAVCQWAENGDKKDFNTINDSMRNGDGNSITDVIITPASDDDYSRNNLHLYKFDDIYTYDDCVENRLVRQHNGWYGFYNKSNIKTYFGVTDDETEANEELGIERVLGYMNSGDFIDMYPSRDLYSFVPKYNKFQNRAEKNWNYCITYPSSSTTSGFEDLIETTGELNALKALYFDENTYDDNGREILVIFSKTKHGLSVGDHVNIYKTTDSEGNTLCIENAEVTIVADDYIFAVFPQGIKLSNEWFDVTSGSMLSITVTDERVYDVDDKWVYYLKRKNPGEPGVYEDRKRYIIDNERVNLSDDTLNISYKKVVNGVECDYYVRVFSRLPNFRFATSAVNNEYDLYGPSSIVIPECQKLDCDFESHVSRMAFARSIYSDEVGQVVYTDNIDLSYLKDNRGRPLTSLYFTVIKNNKGYDLWYNSSNYDAIRNNSSDIEFSHCFGPVTCAFDLSSECLLEPIPSIKTINNIEGVDGIDCEDIKIPDNDTNGTYIDYYHDVNFYGDLVCYDYYNAMETSLQYVLHRFNSAQRECLNMRSGSEFSSYVYDEIVKDDYDINGSETFTKQNTITDTNNFKEGYYYQPHYEIPIRSFGNVNTVMPDMLTVRDMRSLTDGLVITSIERHLLTIGDKVGIYDPEANKKYTGIVKASNLNSERTFVCDVYDDNERINFAPRSNARDVKVFKLDNLAAPSYAHMMNDGTCRYIWRNVYQNGMNDELPEVEEYPFTNGALYVNRQIKVYVRRQDPNGLYGLYNPKDDIDTEEIFETENNYYKPEEIQC
jgi:hypothetical protein